MLSWVYNDRRHSEKAFMSIRPAKVRALRTIALCLFVSLPNYFSPAFCFAPDATFGCLITEAKGTVQKRTNEDWTAPAIKEQFVPASKGDRLKDGMQVATGDKSYAQLTWPDVTSRAWANSIYSIAPSHRLVYLQSGQMLFNLDKHRKDKREYVLWTNLLQARVRGTTVFVQTDGKHSQIAVLEGYIDVLNRKDKSVVRVYPGAVYDIQSQSSTSGGGVGDTTTVPMAPITAGNAIPLFTTNETKVALFTPDTKSLYDMPLVNGFESQLPSLPLITQQLQSLPTGLNALSKVAQIVRVPMAVDYAIGNVVGSALKLPPGAVSYFPPIGYISNEVAGTGDLAHITSGAVNFNTAGLNAIGATTSAASAAQVAGHAAQAANVTQLINTSSISARTSSITGTVGGAIGGVTTIGGSTLGGVTGTLGGTVGGVTGTLGGALGGIHFP
jgi:hypothetical protein